jgi:hypothetical protein
MEVEMPEQNELQTPQPYNIDEVLSAIRSSQASITEQMEIQQQGYATLRAQIDEQAAVSQQAVADFEAAVRAAIEGGAPSQGGAPTPVSLPRTTIDIEGTIAPMRAALEQQLTTMRNAYSSQVAVQAKQLDAATGAGAFGGNAYRAQQAYQNSMNQLMGQAWGAMAETALTAEGNILSAVSALTQTQAQIDFETLATEAGLNVEQEIAFRNEASMRDVQLLTLQGQAAAMAVEASATLTSNWLALQRDQYSSMNNLIGMLGNTNLAEAQIRQQLARDIFQAEQQAINNNLQLQIVMRQAEAQAYVARQSRRAARDRARAAEYVAEVSASANIEIANIQADMMSEQTQQEAQNALDLQAMLMTNAASQETFRYASPTSAEIVWA